MEAERSKHAIARIEAALARIEAAPMKSTASSAPSNGGGAELAALTGKHVRLRDAVQASLEQLDQLIEGAQG